MYDRVDFERWLQTKSRDQRAQMDQPGLELIAQAGVKAGNLTEHPLWDTFLSYLQAGVETAKADVATLRTTLEDPNLNDHVQILGVKAALLLRNERITVLEAVIALPKEIIEQGGRAKLVLDKIESEKAAESA